MSNVLPVATLNTTPSVVPAGLADADELSDLIAAAFADTAVARWLVADPEVRAEIFPLYFRIYVEYALYSGHLYMTEDRSAAALWMPSTGGPLRAPDGYPDRLAAITEEWLDRFLLLDEVLGQSHPQGRAHHRMACLAVQPDRRRQGLGAALLRAHNPVLDAAGMPAYVEASSPAAQIVCRSLGYADHGPPIELPAGPCLYPMWRTPVSENAA
jgi:GNAT superfamily N-acetyltransferase